MTPDEPANLVAGLEYWQTGSSMRYNVNPPLVKLWATIPLVFQNDIQLPRLPDNLIDNSQYRHEFTLGRLQIENRGKDFFNDLVKARRMCIWFAIVGTIGVYSLAGLWLSERASLLAAMLWAFNPITLGYGVLLNCDIAAASMGCWAVVCGVHAIRFPSVFSLLLAGGVLGLAVLTKLTWIVLFPLAIGLVAAVKPLAQPNTKPRVRRLKDSSRGLLAVFLVAWSVILCGYRCEGVFRPLGAFTFVSDLLTGDTRTGNRFAAGWFASLPVPIPFPMLHGFDQQWEDFDHPRYCYLAGKWQRGGWFCYYLVALLVKLPLGLIFLCLLAMRRFRDRREVVFVCAPTFLTCFVLVSSKTNMNEHVRYLWPILPQLIVIASLAFDGPNWRSRQLANVFCLWSIFAGMASLPCGISYFNELAGAKRGGTEVLAGSNIDWGHGWIAALQWLERNPPSTPVVIIPSFRVSLSMYGIKTSTQPTEDLVDIDPIVTVLVGVDERLNLVREKKFPENENSFQGMAGCCVEIHQMRLRSLSQVQVNWLVSPERPTISPTAIEGH